MADGASSTFCRTAGQTAHSLKRNLAVFFPTPSSSLHKKPATSANDIPWSSEDRKNNRSGFNQSLSILAPSTRSLEPLAKSAELRWIPLAVLIFDTGAN